MWRLDFSTIPSRKRQPRGVKNRKEVRKGHEVGRWIGWTKTDILRALKRRERRDGETRDLGSDLRRYSRHISFEVARRLLAEWRELEDLLRPKGCMSATSDLVIAMLSQLMQRVSRLPLTLLLFRCC